MKSSARNTFVAEASISLPEGDAGALHRWLNLKHTGKELIPLTEKVGKAHKKASYAIHRCRRYRMKFEINEKGDWKFVKVL